MAGIKRTHSGTKKYRYAPSVRKGATTTYGGVAKRHRTMRGTKYAGTLSIPRNYGRYASLSGSPMPDRFNASLIYSDTVTLNPGAGTLVHHDFRLNSLYDPDLTGTGHQPRGFDQLMAFYQRYRVYGCKMDVCMLSPAATDAARFKWCVLVSGQSVTPTWTQYAAEEHPNRVSPVYLATHGITAVMPRYTGYVTMKDIYQVKDIEDDADATGTTSSNPPRGAFMQLIGTAIDNFVNPDPIEFQVTLTFYSTFFKPTNPGAS